MNVLPGGQSQETWVRTVWDLVNRAGKALICRRKEGRAARKTHSKLKDIEKPEGKKE